MAVEADTFVIPIKAKDEISKEISNLSDVVKQAVKNINDSLNFSALQNQIQSVSSQISKNTEQINAMTAATRSQTVAVANVEKSLNSYNVALVSQKNNLNNGIDQFGQLNRTILRYGDYVDRISSITRNFGSILKMALDPNTLNKFENLLSIFAALAKMQGLERLSMLLLAAQGKVESLELAITSLAKNGAEDFETLAAGADAFNGNLGTVGYAMFQMNNAISKSVGKTVKTFSSIYLIFQNISDTISDLSVIFRSLMDTINAITDPDYVKNLSKILVILSAFARYKGNREIADFLDDASIKAQNLAVTLEELRVDGALNLDKIADRARTFNEVMGHIQGSMYGTYYAVLIGLVNGLKMASIAFYRHQITVMDLYDAYEVVRDRAMRLEDDIADLTKKFIALKNQIPVLVDQIKNNLVSSFVSAQISLINFTKQIEETLGNLKSFTLNAFTDAFANFLLFLRKTDIALAQVFDNAVYYSKIFYQQIIGIINSVMRFGRSLTDINAIFSSLFGGNQIKRLSNFVDEAADQATRVNGLTASFTNLYKTITLGFDSRVVTNSLYEIYKSLARIGGQLTVLSAISPLSFIKGFEEVYLLFTGRGDLFDVFLLAMDAINGNLTWMAIYINGVTTAFVKYVASMIRADIVTTQMHNVVINLIRIFKEYGKIVENITRIIVQALRDPLEAISNSITRTSAFIISKLSRLASNISQSIISSYQAIINFDFAGSSSRLIANFESSFNQILVSAQNILGQLSSVYAASIDKISKIDISAETKNIFNNLVAGFNQGYDRINKTTNDFILNYAQRFEKLMGAAATDIVTSFASGFVEGVRRPLKTLLQLRLEAVMAFEKVTLSMTKGINPAIIGLTEAGISLAPVLMGLGNVLQQLDNEYAQLAGTISMAVAVALAGFAVAVTTVINKVSDLALAIGDTLFTEVREMEKMFVDAQLSLRAFNFTIDRFGKKLGVEAVGNLEFWNLAVDQMTKNTLFSGKEIRDSIGLIIADTYSLGYQSQRNFEILRIAADIAASQGKKLTDVSLGLVKGLLGATQMAQNFGLVLSEEEIAHTKLAQSIYEQGRSLNNLEKTEARYQLIQKRGQLLQGFATEAMNTSAGAALKLERIMKRLQITMGSKSEFVRELTVAYADLIETLVNVSPVFLSILGSIADFGAVILKIVGTIGKYAITILSVVTFSKILNAVFKEAIFVVPLMNFIFDRATKLVDRKAIAVDGLISVLKNLVVITTGMATISIKEFIEVIKASVVNIQAFTVSILNNPLFIKGAIIAASIYLVYQAAKEFNQVLKDLNLEVPLLAKVVTGLSIVIGGLSAAIATNIKWQTALIVYVNRSTVATGINAVAVKGLTGAFVLLSKAIATTVIVSLKSLALTIVNVTKAVAIFTKSIIYNPLFIKAALISGAIYGVVIAIAELIKEVKFISDLFVDASQETENLTTAAEILGFALDGLKKVVTLVAQVIKTVFVAAVSGAIVSLMGLQALWLKIKEQFSGPVGKLLIKAEIDELKEKVKDLGKVVGKNFEGIFKAYEDLTFPDKALAVKADRDSIDKVIIQFKEMREQMKNLGAEQIKIDIFGNQFEKLDNKVSQTKLAFNKLFDAMVNGAEKTQENFEKLRDSFIEMTKTALEFEKLRVDTFEDIEQQTKSLNLEILKSQGKEIEAAKIVGEERQKEFDKRIMQIRSVFAVTEAEEKKIAAMQVALAAKTQMEIEKAKDKARKEAEQKAAQAAQKELRFAESLSQKIRQLKVEELQAAGELVIAQQIENNNRLAAFDDSIAAYVKEQKAIQSNFKLREKELALIEKTRNALIAKGDAEVESAAKKEQEEAQKALGQDGPKLFGPQQVELIKGAFGDAAGALAESASAFMAPVTGMMAAAQMIVGAIQQLIDFLPNFINSVANLFTSLTDLPKAIFDALLNLGDSIDYFFENFMGNLEEFLPKILETFTKIGTKLFIQLGTELPIRLLGVIGSVKFWNEMITALVNGIINGVKEGLNNVANALGLADIFNINVEEKLKTLGDSITRASDQLFRVVELEQVSRGLDVADRIRMALASGSSQGASFFERLFKKIGDFGTDLWNGFVGAVEDIGKWFGDRGTEIWNGFILPIATWFGDRGTEIWKGFILPIANWFGDRGTEIWNGFILPIANYFEEKGGAIWNGLKEKAGEVTAWAKEKGGAIWNGLKEEAGNITQAFKDFGGAIWDGLKTAAGDATEDLKGFGRKIWDGLRDAIQWPEIKTPGWIQSFIDAVNKLSKLNIFASGGGFIGKVQNSVPSAGSVGAKVSDKWKSIRGYSEGGPVASAIPQGLTKNGILYAQTGALSNAMGTDTIPAMLTPGEFVVNREATRNNLGLLSFINQNKDAVAPGAPQTSTFNITINAKTNLSADQIRREVVPELEKQLRRKSQEGRSVINAAGIRA